MKSNLLSVLEHGAEAVESRRNALAFVGKMGAGALLSMLPFGLADEAKAQSAGDDVAILNYALTLEYLESFFYNTYVFVPSGTVTTPPAGVTPAPIPADVLPLFGTIQADEAKHVAFLRTALRTAAATPVTFARTDFDYTAGGMFTPTDYGTFLIIAQGFEDTGVRAYKGQATNITNKDYLTAALNIHSVEARHAAAVRKVRGLNGWVKDAEESPAPIRATYGAGQTRGALSDPSLAETNKTQGGVPLAATAKYDDRQIQEAFDEPLGVASIKNIVDPFVIPDLG